MGLKTLIGHHLRVAHSVLREAVKRTVTRSPKWRSVEHKMLQQHSICAACGGSKLRQVHHKKPFHIHPELELDPNNLIVLCMGPLECHLKIGHGGSFKQFNPNVEVDAQAALSAPGNRAVIEARAMKARLPN